MGDETGITITFNTAGRILDYNSAFWPTRRGTVTGHVSAPREWFERMPNTPESYRSLIEEQFPKFPKAWIQQASEQLVVSSSFFLPSMQKLLGSEPLNTR